MIYKVIDTRQGDLILFYGKHNFKKQALVTPLINSLVGKEAHATV